MRNSYAAILVIENDADTPPSRFEILDRLEKMGFKVCDANAQPYWFIAELPKEPKP